PTCIAVHPTDPRWVYMGTNTGRIYTFQNRGDDWKEIYAAIDGGSAVRKIYLDPRDASDPMKVTLYVVSIKNISIVKTDDGGAFWSVNSCYDFQRPDEWERPRVNTTDVAIRLPT